MSGYHGGQNVRGGLYLKRSTWGFECIAGKDGILPGDNEILYNRVPLPIVAIAGPLMGLAYVISLPFAFYAGACLLLARHVGRKMKIIGQQLPW